MVHLSWNKLSEKQKQYIRSVTDKSFILGMAYVNVLKLKEIILKEVKKNRLVIIGDLVENYVSGLEDGEQFRKMDFAQVNNILESINSKYQNLLIHLTYSQNDVKFVLREFKPTRMIGFYGSWAGVLHYNSVYWECIKNDIEVITHSPFIVEDEAKKHVKAVNIQNYKRLNNKWKSVNTDNLTIEGDNLFSIDQIIDFCNDVKNLSWDWTGKTGACLTYKSEKRKVKNEKQIDGVWNLNYVKNEFSKEGELKIIAFGQNKISPWEGYTLYHGARREKEFSELGKNAELMESVHAEVHAIINALKLGYDLSKAILWVTKCPCSVCARIIKEAGIRCVIYLDEYSNSDVYQVLNDR